MDRPAPPRPGTQTYLFTLRLWPEEVGTPDAPRTEWRGQVQPVAGGTGYAFRDWPALLTYLTRLTTTLPARPPAAGEADSGS